MASSRLGKIDGIVFAIPFLIFLIRRQIRKEMVIPLDYFILIGGIAVCDRMESW
jgi:hypothetical protein